MRHKNSFRKFGRNASHRRALLRNLATSLILHNRIETTLPKAKDLRRIADGLITLGKTDTLHSRRQAMSYLQPINREATGNAHKLTAVHKLFTELAPRFKERKGGYTRIIRTRKRDGDKAQMALIEYVEALREEKTTSDRRKRRVVKSTESKNVSTDTVSTDAGITEQSA